VTVAVGVTQCCVANPTHIPIPNPIPNPICNPIHNRRGRGRKLDYARWNALLESVVSSPSVKAFESMKCGIINLFGLTTI